MKESNEIIDGIMSMNDIIKEIDFRIIELARIGPKRKYAFDGIYWAEDKEGNKYWELFGNTTSDERDGYLRYSDVKIAVHKMSRFIAERKMVKTCTYRYKMDTEGHLYCNKEDPETVDITEVYLSKPDDWPDMNEPPYFRKRSYNGED